jgi:predicted protein tyrosine phosphatase
MTNILFICSRNQWRSPTAEKIWQRHPQLHVRSAGTSSKAKRKVNLVDLQWADVIFVMESKHKKILKQQFNDALLPKVIHTLEIPDDYQYMDPQLVKMLEDMVSRYLNLTGKE